MLAIAFIAFITSSDVFVLSFCKTTFNLQLKDALDTLNTVG